MRGRQFRSASAADVNNSLVCYMRRIDMTSSCFKNVRNAYGLSLLPGLFFGALMVSVVQAAGPGGGPDWADPNTGRGFRPNLPDFYQHQYLCDNSRPNWEVRKTGGGGGWCAATALANCLYSFKVNGYNGLLHNSPNINDPNKWLDDACKAIEDMEKMRAGCFELQKYLEDRGHGEKGCPGPGGGLKYTWYRVDGATGKLKYKSSDGTDKEKAGPPFKFYKDELKDGQDVLLFLTPGGNTATKPVRWWNNYHLVTGAGFDCGNTPGAKPKIYFSDPDSNKGNDKANAGWHFTWDDAGVKTRKYDPNDPVPVPARGATPSDDPVDWEKFYACVELADPNGRRFGSGADDRYLHVDISGILTICPIKGAPKLKLPDLEGIKKLFRFFTGLYSSIDGILIYPTGASVQPFTPVFPDTEFVDSSGNTWGKTYVSPGLIDPDGNVRSGGGVFFHTAGALPPGFFADASVVTDTDYENYDIMMRLAGSGSWEDATWFVQAIGSRQDELLDLQREEPGVPGIVITPFETELWEGGSPGSYSVALLAAPLPGDPVIVNVSTDSQVQPISQLVFDSENWFLAQAVAVHAIADGVVEGVHSSVIFHAATGSGYNGIAIDNVNLLIFDDPVCGMAGTQFLTSDYNRDCYSNVGDVAFMAEHFLSCTELDLASIECFTLHDFSDLNREFGQCTDPVNASCGINCGNGICEPAGGENCVTCPYDCLSCDVCGNDVAEGTEVCDGSDLRGEGCISLGFNGGVLACDPGCAAYDTSNCTSCFDVQQNSDETDIDCGGSFCLPCPGGAACFVNDDCDSGFCDGGICQFGPSCGNNVAEGTEDCDGFDLRGESCTSLGFEGGNLICDGGCSFDTIECFSCSDAVLNSDETDVDCGGLTCPACPDFAACLANSDCESLNCFDSVCQPAGGQVCGDSVIEGTEVCDGSNLSGQDCISLGHHGGLLGCSGDCLSFDESGCERCDDGLTNGDESDVDCGGFLCQSCPDGGGCNVNEDCTSLNCVDAVCQGAAFCGNTTCEDSVGEGCHNCQADCGLCGSGDCCIESPSEPGCIDQVIMDCVCAIDPYCCAVQWDDICVGEVTGESCGSCGQQICGDGFCDELIQEGCNNCQADCGPCSSQDCCVAHPGEPGCNDPAIMDCVCGQEPACCVQGWDQNCVNTISQLECDPCNPS
jgi:hypothetical protein